MEEITSVYVYDVKKDSCRIISMENNKIKDEVVKSNKSVNKTQK